MQTAIRPLADPAPVDVTWRGFLDGTFRFIEIVRSDATCRVVVRSEALGTGVRLTSRERSVVQRLAEGHEQKVIAYDLGVGPGTVCGHLRAALEKLGMTAWQHAVLVAALLERPDRTIHSIDEEERAVTTGTEGPHRMVRAELCGNALRRLTRAEREVALRIVDGCSALDIAEERNSSPRTVANQMGSISEKLSTHGRQALIRRLALPNTAFGSCSISALDSSSR